MKLASFGIEYSLGVLRPESDKPVQTVDIDTKEKMARASLWESGECDFEAIECETGTLIAFEHRVIETEFELNDFLSKFVFRL